MSSKNKKSKNAGQPTEEKDDAAESYTAEQAAEMTKRVWARRRDFLETWARTMLHRVMHMIYQQVRKGRTSLHVNLRRVMYMTYIDQRKQGADGNTASHAYLSSSSDDDDECDVDGEVDFPKVTAQEVLLRKPTAEIYLPSDKGLYWRLVEHLTDAKYEVVHGDIATFADNLSASAGKVWLAKFRGDLSFTVSWKHAIVSTPR